MAGRQLTEGLGQRPGLGPCWSAVGQLGHGHSHSAEQGRGCVGLGKTAVVPEPDSSSRPGTEAAGEAIPIVSVSCSGAEGEEAADCQRGLESFLRGQEGGRIGNGPLEEKR